MAELSQISLERNKAAALKSFETTITLVEQQRGSGMAFMIIEHIGEERLALDRATEQEQTIRAAQAEAAKIGLHFDWEDEQSMTVFSSAGKGDPARSYYIEATQPARLEQLLKSIRPDDLEQRPQLKAQLATLAGALISQIRREYQRVKDKEPDSTMSDLQLLVEKLSGCGELLQQLSINHAAELNDYIQHTQKLALEEYITLQDAQCLEEPNSHRFGPSEWHTDCTVEDYQRRWSYVIQGLQFALRNPRAAEVTQRAIQNVLACIDTARADMEVKLPQSELYKFYQEVFPKFLSILEQTRTECEQLNAQLATQLEATES